MGLVLTVIVVIIILSQPLNEESVSIYIPEVLMLEPSGKT